MIRLLAFIFLFLSGSHLKSQNIEFFREDLTFEIKNGYFYVDGIYHFCNIGNKPEKNNLYYPFPIDSIYGCIDSISITNLNSQQKVEYITNKEKGIYFNIFINSYDIEKYRIKYRQKLKTNQAEYILTSTQAWKKPFELVNYKLITDSSVKIISLSYEADSVHFSKINNVYYWQKKDFMPNKNMVIRFVDDKNYSK